MLDGGEAANKSRLKIAVVGAGISGLSAAWLLFRRHDVTIYEKDSRLGGHSNTIDVPTPEGAIPVDTGFIVFNPKTYPNLCALFRNLGVETVPSSMSFAVSLDDGALEYGGASVASLFAQRRNLANPRFWSMLRDLVRFYKEAPASLSICEAKEITLGDYLLHSGYGATFCADHLLPMASAIWSASPETLKRYPAAAFIRFFDNHGLLDLKQRPQWRTVTGGSRTYVSKISSPFSQQARLRSPVRSVHRDAGGVIVATDKCTDRYDRLIVAAHADEALAMLADPSEREQRLLGAFRYTPNRAVLHSDPKLMPKRRAVWSSWNYLGDREDVSNDVCVTYWMNRLQTLGTCRDLFVTLNPRREPAPGTVIRTEHYDHPVFTLEALRAQRELASLQGDRNTWFCGAYFGSGFHEDGLKSGLDAAEAIGGLDRPWKSSSSAHDATFNKRGYVAQ